MNELIELAKRVNGQIDSKTSKRNQENNSIIIPSSSVDTSSSVRIDQKKKNKKKKKRKLILEQEESIEKIEDTTRNSLEEEEDGVSMKRRKRNEGNHSQENNDNVNEETTELRNDYPYEVNSDDHCETKVEAYEIIADLLDAIAAFLQKTRSTISIYDPYYCEGTMVAAMNSLGFETVYNRKEDFYEIQRLQRVPSHDILITNPPYSDDHIRRLLEYATNCNKPYFLLMPNFVYAKDYYSRVIPKSKLPFYILPTKRLQYTTPKGRRQSKSGKYTSPFPSFWYCHLGPLTHLLKPFLDQQLAQPRHLKSQQQQQRVIVTSCHQLPVEVLADNDPRKKKERNALKRKKNKEKKKFQQQATVKT